MRLAAPILLGLTLLVPFAPSVEAAKKPAYEPKAKSCERLSKRVLRAEQKSSEHTMMSGSHFRIPSHEDTGFICGCASVTGPLDTDPKSRRSR